MGHLKASAFLLCEIQALCGHLGVLEVLVPVSNSHLHVCSIINAVFLTTQYNLSASSMAIGDCNCAVSSSSLVSSG